MSPTAAATTKLEAARARRAELYEALRMVEHRAASPSPNREPQWRHDIAVALGALDAAFQDHVGVTEGPEGLLEDIARDAPRLSGPAARLGDEHPSLSRYIKATRDVATSAPVEEVRVQVLRLLGRLSRHRQRGSDLVYEAYEVDMGTID